MVEDDKGNRGGRDRATVSGDETYELDYFANKHDLSRDDAKALIDRIGNNRHKLETAVADRTKVARAKSERSAKAPVGAGRARAKIRKGASSSKVTSVKTPKSRAETVTGAAGPVLKTVAAAPRKALTAAKRNTALARKSVAAALSRTRSNGG